MKTCKSFPDSDRARCHAEGLSDGRCVAHAILMGWAESPSADLPYVVRSDIWRKLAETWAGYNPNMGSPAWQKGFRSALLGQGIVK